MNSKISDIWLIATTVVHMDVGPRLSICIDIISSLWWQISISWGNVDGVRVRFRHSARSQYDACVFAGSIHWKMNSTRFKMFLCMTLNPWTLQSERTTLHCDSRLKRVKECLLHSIFRQDDAIYCTQIRILGWCCPYLYGLLSSRIYDSAVSGGVEERVEIGILAFRSCIISPEFMPP